MKWNTTKKENMCIDLIVSRVKKDEEKDNNQCYYSLMDLAMTISAVHCNGNKLDLKRLLDADDFTFYHDIQGMMQNIDTRTGKLNNHFLPRCTAHQKSRRAK